MSIEQILCFFFHLACAAPPLPAPITSSPAAVPEPSTYALLGVGLVFFSFIHFKKKQ
jgi:hypothetical protein